ncbi:hypothetical protein GHT06_013797 [Daphnia sinensis]|uniref:Transmembrane protein n=1 Tax=Daphnia sinensis TaxID=1820382 RepID=A0AAD5LD92_9CRUS|nr:hypothetical protein GHT06_013797 [Daphnia sinensis]
MAYGMNFKTTSIGDYPNMKVKSIRIFASICIASGIVSILLQACRCCGGIVLIDFGFSHNLLTVRRNGYLQWSFLRMAFGIHDITLLTVVIESAKKNTVLYKMVLGLNLKKNSNVDYSEMKVKSIRVASAICIICGIASIGMQIAAITIFLAKLGYYYITFTSDVVGYGIWGGALNVIAGCLGIALTYVNEKTLLIAVVVVATLSILASFLITLLSALAASLGFYSSCLWLFESSTCDIWLQLEWSLMGCGILAFISSIALVILAPQSLCTCCRRQNDSADKAETFKVMEID